MGSPCVKKQFNDKLKSKTFRKHKEKNQYKTYKKSDIYAI